MWSRDANCGFVKEKPLRVLLRSHIRIHWIQTRTVYSHPLYFNLAEHCSLLAPPVLSTRLHPHISFHLPTYQSSLYLWPFTRLYQLPAAQTASHPAFNTIMFFPKASCSSQPIPLTQPPASISLPFPKTLLSPLSLTHPSCHFAAPLYCTQENRRYYLPNCTNDTCLCVPLSVSDNICRSLLHQAIIKIQHFIPSTM